MQYPQTPSVNDYRCVVNAAGTQVIFERSPYTASADAKNDSDLYLLDLPPGNSAVQILEGPEHAVARPLRSAGLVMADGDLVIFNWIGQDGSLQIGLARQKTAATVQPLKHTDNM